MKEGPYLFTSESVSEGHPDKLADQISDAVLDACLRNDPDSRVGCETFTTTGMVLVGGEITTHSEYVDVQEIARGVAKKAGHTSKVDRSGAYMARYVANNIVAAWFCRMA